MFFRPLSNGSLVDGLLRKFESQMFKNTVVQLMTCSHFPCFANVRLFLFFLVLSCLALRFLGRDYQETSIS